MEPPLRTVGVFPGWTSNPYLEELEKAVSPHGYQFVYPGSSPAQFEFLDHVRSLKLDVVHLHWQHPFILGRNRVRSGARAARFLLDLARIRREGVPVVWTIHNVVSHERRHEFIERLASSALFRIADQVTVHCSDVIELVRATYWLTIEQRSRMAVVPHGNYSASYDSAPDRRSARDALGIDPDALVYLHFGHLRTYKHVDSILRAFHALAEPRATLLIAGRPHDSGIRTEIENLALRDSRVRLFIQGAIPDADVPTFFAAADVFVYAAFEILMSGAVILALTHGLPIVAPRVGCLPDVIPDDGAFWYAPYDEQGLLRALQSSTTGTLDTMSRTNRAASLRESWADIGERWAEIYSGVLAARG